MCDSQCREPTFMCMLVACGFDKERDPTISSSVWPTWHLQWRRRHCGTTPSVVNTRARLVSVPQSRWSVHATCRRTDISSCSFLQPILRQTYANWKRMFAVSKRRLSLTMVITVFASYYLFYCVTKIDG